MTPIPQSTVQSIRARNHQAQNNRAYQNMLTTIDTDLYIIHHLGGGITYKFHEPFLWQPSVGIRIHLCPRDPDKFSVTQDTFELAKSEFWARFHIWKKASRILNGYNPKIEFRQVLHIHD